MHTLLNIYSAQHNDDEFANLQVKFDAENEENVFNNAIKVSLHLQSGLGNSHYKCIMANNVFDKATVKGYVANGSMQRIDSEAFGVVYTNCVKIVEMLEEATNHNID